MVEEIEEMAEAAAVEAAPEETPEQRDERLKREEWEKRDAAAWEEREAVYRANGLLKPGETLSRDSDAAAGRCCF